MISEDCIGCPYYNPEARYDWDCELPAGDELRCNLLKAHLRKLKFYNLIKK